MFDFKGKDDQLKLEIFPKKLKELRIEQNFLVEQIALHLGITKKDWLQAQASAFTDDGTWLDPLKIITTGKY